MDVKTYCSRFGDRGCDTEDGNYENACSVIIVVVKGPENEACYLEDVEGMNGLMCYQLISRDVGLPHEEY